MTEKYVKAREAERAVEDLLRDWCDALVDLQVDRPDNPALDGGILCPACGMIHGRCHEAVYPLLCMAKWTGDQKYRTAAKRLFAWGENMMQNDGSCINDTKSDWKGITVFAAIALHDALDRFGDQLAQAERERWTKRLAAMGEWLYANLTICTHAYINYLAANACAMALLGRFFFRAEYTKRSHELADYCFAHISENNLLYGEGKPHDARTAKGCRAIDIGYNAEESLPSLVRYAGTSEDNAAMEQCRKLYAAHLMWMLPDGAWDDSFGTRSFKWSYWGSRTADGCQAALFTLGRQDPVFANAAWMNFRQLRRCTQDRLLAGGPDYGKIGEKVCVHHTFCHAKVLAGALDAGLYDFPVLPLPALSSLPLQRFAELDTYRMTRGDFLADVTGYDARYKQGGHVSGGTVSLLWHRRCGIITAAGMAEYTLFEPFNQQLPRFPQMHRPSFPQITATIEGETYAQSFDYAAVLQGQADHDAVRVQAIASLCRPDGKTAPEYGGCKLIYTLRDDSFCIEGSVPSAVQEKAAFILPILSDMAHVEVLQGKAAGEPEHMYALSPGFAGVNYTIIPDAQGAFSVRITVST